MASCAKDPTTEARTYTVRMADFSYSPAELTVPRNAKVSLVNEGAVGHSWILKGAGVGTALVRPGQTVVLDFKDVPPGVYTVYCDQPGHTQSGQSGRLTIVA